MSNHDEYPHELVWRWVEENGDFLVGGVVAIGVAVVFSVITAEVVIAITQPVEITCGPVIGYQPSVSSYAPAIVLATCALLILWITIKYTGGIVPHD